MSVRVDRLFVKGWAVKAQNDASPEGSGESGQPSEVLVTGFDEALKVGQEAISSNWLAYGRR